MPKQKATILNDSTTWGLWQGCVKRFVLSHGYLGVAQRDYNKLAV
jgi:hypothetical protein